MEGKAANRLRGKRALVTGATGFVGQHVIRQLLAAEPGRVRILTRSPARARECFGSSDPRRLEVAVGDLSVRDEFEPLCEDIDVIFHAAALAPHRPGVTNAAPIFKRLNVEGTARLARAAAKGRRGETYLLHSDGHHTLRQILKTAGRLVGNARPYRRSPLALAYIAVGALAPLAYLAGRTPSITTLQLSQFLSQ